MVESGTIEQRIEAVKEKISTSALHSGRQSSDITLVGVTKTRTVAEMLAALPLIDAIGENRVQEAASKKREWPADKKALWRLIGHLQCNKARKALTFFDTIDSVDSLALVGDLNRIATEMGRTVPVLIEVNTSGETSKTGAAPQAVAGLVDGVMQAAALKLEGFMTIGPLTDDESSVRGAFASLRDIAAGARERTGLPLPVLSMGMSGDFEWAIAEGSTMVRIGTMLFGPR